MTRYPALGVVRLRRRIFFGRRAKGVGRGVVVECGLTPAAAVRVRESLGVLDDEVDVRLGTRHFRRRIGSIRALCGLIMDLGDLGAVGERLAVAGDARTV